MDIVKLPKETPATTTHNSSFTSTTTTSVTSAESKQSKGNKSDGSGEKDEEGKDDKGDKVEPSRKDVMDTELLVIKTVIVLRKESRFQLAVLKFNSPDGKVALDEIKRKLKNLDLGFNVDQVYSGDGVINFEQTSSQAWEAYSNCKNHFIISVTGMQKVSIAFILVCL